jgi:hypothetical protein
VKDKFNIRDCWIEKGYRIFAYEGPMGLKIEPLAKIVGKNKSCFYHLFADLQGFISVLIDYHLEQAKIVAFKESACRRQEDLISVLTEHKVDLLFNRQLRVHRENIEFETCLGKTTNLLIPAIMPFWKQMIELQNHSYLAELVLQLTLENFFLQVTDETLNQTWLGNYFDNIRNLVRHFKHTKSISSLDGSV